MRNACYYAQILILSTVLCDLQISCFIRTRRHGQHLFGKKGNELFQCISSNSSDVFIRTLFVRIRIHRKRSLSLIHLIAFAIRSGTSFESISSDSATEGHFNYR